MQAPVQELFEPAIIYPDPDIKERFDQLIGLDSAKERLAKILALLICPEGVKAWAEKFHPDAKTAVSSVLRRPPLVVLAGDVGSGKSELATTIGDHVARRERIEVTLLPLSLSTRGQGRVGEMTQLISAAFDHTVQEAKKLVDKSGKSRGAVILHVDEADALAQSRENAQMHHEDKAGVNAFIRGIDRLANGKLPAAVIMCTNRLSALDPAIKRRSADIVTFGRPTEEQRHQVLSGPLRELGISPTEINEIVELTGPTNGHEHGFTFSDLTQRLIPGIVLDSFPDHAVQSRRAVEIARSIIPTPPFKD